VLCAGSTLLLAKQSLDEAPYKLSAAVAKLASITFRRLAFSWTDKPWFLTKGKLPAVLIIPSSWGSQLDGEITSTPCRISPPGMFPMMNPALWNMPMGQWQQFMSQMNPMGNFPQGQFNQGGKVPL
jgi:hypothetical protein